jgi:Na+/phosphate symporter
MRAIVPILLLIAGIMLVYIGVDSPNTGAFVGYTFMGIGCMFVALAYIMDDDNV